MAGFDTQIGASLPSFALAFSLALVASLLERAVGGRLALERE